MGFVQLSLRRDNPIQVHGFGIHPSQPPRKDQQDFPRLHPGSITILIQKHPSHPVIGRSQEKTLARARVD